MNARTTHVLGEALLVVGLLCFAIGAGLFLLGRATGASAPVLGVFALVFVGAGTAVRTREHR